MWEFLTKLKFPAIVFISGVLFAFVSLFNAQDIAKLSVTPRLTLFYPGLFVGLILVIGAVLVMLSQENLIPTVNLSRARKTKYGFAAQFGRTKINVHFGRVEKIVGVIESSGSRHAIVLPANEYFDDECLAAPNTALGAFVQERFGSSRSELFREVASARTKLVTKGQFEKEKGKLESSFGTGTCLYIPNPPGVAQSLILAAVATKRAGIGITSNLTDICNALEHMFAVINDERICVATLPLLGAGKGGLSPEISLEAILLALSVAIRQRKCGTVETINLVIYRDNDDSPPVISRATTRRMLSIASYMHARYS